ncbi:MAG TPA: polysaccharide biosynthesis tyrosine autokinase [Pyrinomonadaceae bacterium]|nr:polysaccharide biosynthesis tyrosine autokinase [Pyrinomonadaceae bacterium]
MDDPKENGKAPSEIARALAVISNVSRGLPASFANAEEARYPGSYGPPNRVDEGVRLRDVWIAISKRRWMIALIVVLVTATTAVMLARKPDIYLAETDVQVDTEGPASGLTSGKGNIIVDTGSDPSYFNTQLQIITKPGLLRRVVKTLDLEHNPDFLRAQANDTAWQRLLRTFGLNGGSSVAQTPAQKAENDKLSLDKQVASASSPDNLEEAARLEPFVSSLQLGLKVDPIKDERLQFTETRLISIKFTHANPLVAAKVANAIANAFVLSNLEQKTKFTSTTGDFLQQRIAELQSQIRADEERLINYAKGHEILSLDAAQNTVVDRLSGLNKQLLEAENERKIAEANYRVSKEPGAADVLGKDGTKDLDEELTKLKQKRAQLLVDNTEEWPEVKEVQKQIAAVEKEIQDARSKAVTTGAKTLEMRYHEALDREQALRTAFEQQRGATRTQNEAAINYHIIQQEIETNKTLLDSLLQRAKENDVVLAGTPNNLHVTDYATPPRVPIGPNRLQGVILGFLFSLGFGVCLATLLEYLDDSVRSSDDVSRMLRLPTLATIPMLKNGRLRRALSAETTSLQLQNGNGNGHKNGNGRVNPALLLDVDQRSPLAEAYRHLRTSVLLSSAGHAPKTLVVTSCVPSEGKTTTAINLGVTLAQTGARVLVIDGDMRRPTVHRSFGAENKRGLSNILSNEMSEAEMLALVQKEEESGLYLLTSGPLPPNPAELIGSDQMRRVVLELGKTFDHVVIDTPPIASFTDGVLMATISDGVILVIHANECSRKVVQRSRQALLDVGAKVLGVVLNRVDMRSHDYYYGYREYAKYNAESDHYSSAEEASPQA